MSFASFDPDMETPPTVNIYCSGCKKEFAGLRNYSAHNCPQPQSGEAYR